MDTSGKGRVSQTHTSGNDGGVPVDLFYKRTSVHEDSSKRQKLAIVVTFMLPAKIKLKGSSPIRG